MPLSLSVRQPALFPTPTRLTLDNAYLPDVERTIAAWGQPKVSVRRLSGRDRVVATSNQIDMLWKRGDGTELSISFSPEGRDGAGALRYNRGTSIKLYRPLSRLSGALTAEGMHHDEAGTGAGRRYDNPR